jgi:hypothetical protein
MIRVLIIPGVWKADALFSKPTRTQTAQSTLDRLSRCLARIYDAYRTVFLVIVYISMHACMHVIPLCWRHLIVKSDCSISFETTERNSSLLSSDAMNDSAQSPALLPAANAEKRKHADTQLSDICDLLRFYLNCRPDVLAAKKDTQVPRASLYRKAHASTADAHPGSMHSAHGTRLRCRFGPERRQ